MSAAGFTPLRAGPDGRVIVRCKPSEADPDQLAKLRAHRDELADVLAVFGEAEVCIRPATPIPDQPPVRPPFVQPLPPRRWRSRQWRLV